jgi:hypothetical protein
MPFAMWAWSPPHADTKEIGIALARRFAIAARSDGLDHPTICQIGGLGTNGAHPSNAERDFHRAFGTEAKLGFEMRPTFIKVPMIHRKSGLVVDVALPVLAPHELFATLYGAGEHVFERSLVRHPSGLGYLPTFWSGMAEEPWVAAHPAMEPSRNCRTRGVPLFIHADETQYVNNQKVYVISISGLAHGDPVTTKLLVALIPSDRMYKDGGINVTLQAVLAYVKLSFEVLLDGKWPAPGYEGTPLDLRSRGPVRSTAYRARRAGQRLAGEYFGVFAGVKGDQLWMQDAFNFDRYHRTNELCRFCHASQSAKAGPMLWTNVADDAPWKSTMEPSPMHGSLVGLPGLHDSNIYSDLLHLLWVHGIGNDLVGTALVLLAANHAFSAEPGDLEFESQLYCGYGTFKKWCDDVHVSTTAEPWTPNDVHYTQDKDFPYLGGKGADVRLISQWLHHFMQETPRPLATEWWDDLKLCLHNLASFVHGTSSAGILLTAGESTKLRRVGEAFVVVYLRCAAWAVRNRYTQFKIRPKLHYFHHLVMSLKVFNPKVVSCFGDESYMGVIGKLAGKVHRASMPRRTIDRYLLRLSRVIREAQKTTPAP